MLQCSSKYDSTIIEKLEKEDWDTVLPRVFKYAISRAKIFKWLGDEIEPEALVNEAIARAYGKGTGGSFRNWNQEACPDLASFLNGIIRSMTSHMAEHEKEFPSESLYYENGSAKDKKILKSCDGNTELTKPQTPEDEIIEKENLQALISKLDNIAKEDEDLGLVILCIEDGVSDPRNIATATGFDRDKVYNLLKRLRRKLRFYKAEARRLSPIERREE